MGSAPGTRARRRAGWRLLRSVYGEQRRALAVSIGGGLAWQLVAVAVPLVLGWTVERGIVEGDLSAAWWGGAALVALGVAEALTDVVRHTAETRAEARATGSLRERVATAVVRFGRPARDEWPAGQLVARATSDGDAVAASAEAAGYMVAYALAIPVIVALLVGIDGVLAVAVVLVVLATAILTWMSAAVWERREAAAQGALSDAIAAAETALEGFTAIRGVGAEAGVLASFARRSAAAEAAATRTARLWVVFEPLLALSSSAAVVIVLFIGGGRAVDGAVSLGELVAALGLALFLATPVRAVGDGAVMLQRTMASASRVADVLGAAGPAVAGARDGDGDGGPAPAVTGALRADSVSFAYPGRPVLDGVSFALEPGRLAVVDGPVGAGKTTLLALLAGERAPTSGTLTLGGADVAGMPDGARRAAVLRLGPAPFLLAASVADNLRLGAPGAADQDLAEALERAGASAFVEEIGGLDAVLADRGASLSGGQRQRLALARALLARPRALLLDGATSALEPHLEREVLARVAAAWGHGVVVVVSATPGVRDLADVVIDLPPPVWAGGEAP